MSCEGRGGGEGIVPGLGYDDVVDGLSFAAEARESDAYDHFFLGGLISLGFGRGREKFKSVVSIERGEVAIVWYGMV